MRLRRARNDDGATLIVVLILVTVISVLLGAVLAQADTNERATVGLRVAATNNYGTDAAADAAVRSFENNVSGFGCTDPATPSTASFGSATDPYYTSSNSSGSLNASATCSPEVASKSTIGSGTVTLNSLNTLGFSVLTTGTVAGQTYGSVCLWGGSAISNSFLSAGSLEVGAPINPNLACGTNLKTDPTISVTPAQALGCNGAATDTKDYAPTKCLVATSAGGSLNIPVPVPSATWQTYATTPTSGYTVTDPAPLCPTSAGKKYAVFLPGKYTSASIATLNSPCNKADFEWFPPGTYYFDFGPTTWDWSNFLVGGTPQDASGNVVASLANYNFSNPNLTTLGAGLASVRAANFPGACADPALQKTYGGVEFVFGGSSNFLPASTGTDELCASAADGTSGNKIPVSIYGVSADVAGGASLALNGGGSISSETLCAGTPPCTSASADSGTKPLDSLIQFDSNGHNTFFNHGYIYAPSVPISFRIKNAGPPLLGWGIVARSLAITTNGASPQGAYLAYRPALHQAATTVYSVRFINVWTCAASSSGCPMTGTPNVRVKLQSTLDANGNVVAGSTKVLSWSHLR